jgi:hypothetical protein
VLVRVFHKRGPPEVEDMPVDKALGLITAGLGEPVATAPFHPRADKMMRLRNKKRPRPREDGSNDHHRHDHRSEQRQPHDP